LTQLDSKRQAKPRQRGPAKPHPPGGQGPAQRHKPDDVSKKQVTKAHGPLLGKGAPPLSKGGKVEHRRGHAPRAEDREAKQRRKVEREQDPARNARGFFHGRHLLCVLSYHKTGAKRSRSHPAAAPRAGAAAQALSEKIFIIVEQ